MMNEVLRPYLDKFCVVYLDDILIFSKTPEEHLQHIDAILSKLEEHKLHVQLRKCFFGRNEAEFLGHVVSKEGIKVDPKKIAAVKVWPQPSNTTEVRSFLGFANYYRRFVRDYSKIAAPLTDLTKSTVPYRWTPAATVAFEALKNSLMSTPVLMVPRTGVEEEFVLYTDASGFALGAVLLQDQGDGLRPIAFEARKFNPAERNYPIHEQELLAVVHALRHWRCYLEGCKKVTVITDHDTLRHFFNQKDLSRRQARWLALLATYQGILDIVYRRGADNHADALSRRPDLKTELEKQGLLSKDDFIASLHVSTPISSSLLDEVQAAYSSDRMYTEGHKRPHFLSFSNGLWWVQERICIPASPPLRLKVISMFHDPTFVGHPGREKTYEQVRRHFWWRNMEAEVRAYVKSCATCQRVKPTSHAPYGLLQPLPTPKRPWSHVSLDLITDLPMSDGYDSIVVFVDLLTKQAFFVPTNKTVNATQLAGILLSTVFRHRGLPRVLVSDRDPRFVSDMWNSLFTKLGTKLNISTAYHPQTDGQTERTNRTLEQLLRCYVHPLHDDWVQYLSIVEFAYNSNVSASTKHSPFFTNLGYEPDTPATLQVPPSSMDGEYLAKLKAVHICAHDNVVRAKEVQTKYANLRRSPHTFKVGDEVRLSAKHLSIEAQPTAKLRDRWIGPLKIVEQVNPVAFRLALPPSMHRVHPVFHVSLLEKWVSDSRPQDIRPPPICNDAALDNVYAVDHILDVRVNVSKSGLQFLVRWSVPFDSSEHDTWEPLRNVRRLRALTLFLRSDAWAVFTATPLFREFATRHPSRIPSKDG
jgi:hypothetical protein